MTALKPETPGSKGSAPQPSPFWSSPNAIALIVGILFTIVFLGYIVTVNITPALNAEIGTHVWAALSLMFGFFTGSATTNRKK